MLLFWRFWDWISSKPIQAVGPVWFFGVEGLRYVSLLAVSEGGRQTLLLEAAYSPPQAVHMAQQKLSSLCATFLIPTEEFFLLLRVHVIKLGPHR